MKKTKPAADPARPIAAGVSGGGLTNSQTMELRNYDLSKVTTHTLRPRGDIERLSVAVLLDDSHQPQATQSGQPASATIKPRTAEDLQKIQGLVSASVGLDAERRRLDRILRAAGGEDDRDTGDTVEAALE